MGRERGNIGFIMVHGHDEAEGNIAPTWERGNMGEGDMGEGDMRERRHGRDETWGWER